MFSFGPAGNGKTYLFMEFIKKVGSPFTLVRLTAVKAIKNWLSLFVVLICYCFFAVVVVVLL